MVVGSVLNSLGYHLRVTGCSHDGGIDIFMIGRDGESIGIQVKRLKRKVGPEQIRSFLGALTLGDCKRGVFVTTSTYSRSSQLAAEEAGRRGTAIKLINGPGFEKLLKTAQMQDFQSEDQNPNELAPLGQIPLEIIFENHMNSL